jgi:tight adherence protein B
MTYTKLLIILLIVACFTGLFLYILNLVSSDTSSAAKKRIKEIKSSKNSLDKSNANQTLKTEENQGFFSNIAEKFNLQFFQNFQLAVFQSGANITPDKVILYALILAFLIFLIVYINSSNIFIPFIMSLLGFSLPIFFIYHKAKKRREKFKHLFPEAVDFLSRSLKAGQSISASFGMIGNEYPDPLGSEFKQVFDELNYGLSFNQALENLALRNQDEDLDFFVASLIIQRESGGNLIELLTNLTKLIRERIKVHGKINTLTAEGRLSGNLLSILPFFMAGIMLLLNPKYIAILWETNTGQTVSYVAIILLIVGIIWMKKLVNIKV